MTGSPLVQAALLAASLLVAGCFSTGPSDDGPTTPHTPCTFPAPCGGEWPEGLQGPFNLQAGDPELVTVESHDGTLLRGWVWRPDLPDGARAPVVLISSPYHGGNQEAPGDGSGGAGDHSRYIQEGYGVAEFSVRGTGLSSGCFQNKGLAEQRDQPVLVEWLAEQPWTNGRIAMAGTSYPGTTPIMAAAQHAPHLVTILINGPVTDPYTELHTPQGALYTMGGPYEAGRRALVSLNPEAALTLPPEGVAAGVQILAERICPDVLDVYAGAEQGHFSDDRNGAFWKERQLVNGMPGISIPVFLSHGLQETAHPFQEDIAWDALGNTTKRMLFGQWDHEYPRVEDWQGEMIAWLDHWLKGIGDSAPGLGTVTYQDGEGEWHNSTSWPPAPRQDVAFFLEGATLGKDPPHAPAVSFRSVPPAPREGTGAPREQLCGTAPPGTGLVFRSDLEAGDEFNPVLLAGNPYLLLSLSSDLPGGIVSAHLYRETFGQPCETARLLTFGTADLRFHDGVFQGHDFPTNTPTAVRIDFNNMAEQLQYGQSLALVLSYGDTISTDEVADPITDARFSRSGQPYLPTLAVTNDGPSVGGDSFLVLPIVSGLLDAADVPEEAPPRPFTPPTMH